jgi:hypothetical protein
LAGIGREAWQLKKKVGNFHNKNKAEVIVSWQERKQQMPGFQGEAVTAVNFQTKLLLTGGIFGTCFCMDSRVRKETCLSRCLSSPSLFLCLKSNLKKIKFYFIFLNCFYFQILLIY